MFFTKGDQPWDFFGRNDAKAETPVLWPPHVKSWLIGKDSDAGRDWGQEEKGTAEDEIDGWMASLTRWMWVWVNFGSWWWPGRPGVLQFMGSQRVGHDWATELDWTEHSNSLAFSECHIVGVAQYVAFSNGLISLKFPPWLLCDLTADFFFFSFTAESTWGSKNHMVRKWQNHTLNLALVESWKWKWKWSRSVVSNSLQSHGL